MACRAMSLKEKGKRLTPTEIKGISFVIVLLMLLSHFYYRDVLITSVCSNMNDEGGHNVFGSSSTTTTSTAAAAAAVVNQTFASCDPSAGTATASTSHDNCLLHAFVKYGHIYDTMIRPTFFFMNTSSVKAYFFGVPGDEEHWRKLSRRYTWQGSAATAIFVGEFFRRLSEKIPKENKDSGISLIDVGGNMGQEAVIAGLYGFTSVTFEIVARSVSTIMFNIEANCLKTGRNQVVLSGVGKNSSVIEIDSRGFTAGKGYNGATTVEQENTPSSNHFLDRVHVWSLDDYFLDSSPLSARPYLFKLDCEGCEGQALEGSLQLLEQYPPHYIMVEVTQANIENSLLARLQNEFGYKRSFVVAQDDMWVPNPNMDQVQSMIFALHKKEWIGDGKLTAAVYDLLLVHETAIDLGFF